MDNPIQNNFCFNYKHILIEEIALNGLEGIGLDLLWKYVQKRISSTLTDKMKSRLWNYIVNSKTIKFYTLPEPLPEIEIQDRFMLIDNDIGYLRDPEDYVDGPYEYSPVENENGSCVHYKTRILIPNDNLKLLGYDKVLKEYGNTLVMVASMEERWHALAPHMSMGYLNTLTPVHYCILELVGKARENGQMTVGKTNLTKIIKDPKLLFYNRKNLQKLELIKAQHATQVTNGKAIKNILLRLKRFYKPTILSLPKFGTVRNVVEYLRLQPGYCERTDVVLKKGLLTQPQNKRFQKTINIFNYDERPITSDGIVKSKTKKGPVKRKYIYLSSKSDDESQSDEEPIDEPLKCQYKVGMNLLRQAYERFLAAGLNGLTQIEISQLLGVEFYTSRTICRLFKAKKIVREFLEDRGRQRTARYVAIASTGDIDIKYAEEKKKFLEYLDNNKSETNEPEHTNEVPKKKVKLEETNDINNPLMTEENVTEVKVLDGFENIPNESLLKSKKEPTLRQLKFANGLLKVTREKLAISGYQTLSNLVANEIGDTPMDTKALKYFVQRLVIDGQLRILKLKWPGCPQKFSTLICAPNINKNDPIIKSKYKEISLRSLCNKTTKSNRVVTDSSKSLAEYSYPRYMKIQKLHEFIINFVYFNNVKNDLPDGCASLVNVIPELTVEFAIGNISNMCINEISHLKITDDIFHLKLREAPGDLFKVLLQSSSLQNSIKLNLKVLAMLGLLQLIDSTNSQAIDIHSGITGYLFYVNRHAKIIDTTGVWPRENVDFESLEKSFEFKSFEDVKYYWSRVCDISCNTIIELPGRRSKKLMPPVRKQSEVLSFDTGLQFGDGLGPCGFDSSFYMEIPRLWRTFYTKMAKSKHPQIRKKPKIKKIPKIDIKKKPKIVPKLKKKLVLIASKEDLNTGGRLNVLRSKRKNDTSVKWSSWDDTVIMMCKAAIIIMSPSSQPGSLRVRNVVAKDLLTLTDPKKCASLCHRRANTLESNSTLTHEKDCIINELRRRRHLIQKYEGLLKKIRIRYSTNMTKFMNEARLLMLELLWIIYQVRKSRSFSQRLPCVAMNIDDFYKNYMISSSSANRYYSMYKTPLDEPVIAALKEAIVLTTMLSYNNSVSVNTATKIYHLFKIHPERNLRTALEQLKKSGAVSAKDKILNNLMHKFTYKDTIQSSYKISGIYQRRWTNRLNSEFIEDLANCLNTELPQNSVKASSEVNCLLCELQTSDVLEIISVTLPVITGSSGSIFQEEQLNVIDIEMKFKLKSGTIGWKSKSNVINFSELYKNHEKDYEKFLGQIVRNFIFETNMDSEEPCVEEKDEIIAYLKLQAEKGCTYNDLQKLFNHESKDLVQRLRDLESKNIIKRVGYYENRILLFQYVKPWTLPLENKSIIPTPWMTLNGDIRHDIFFKWAGVVMNKVYENPGCSLLFLSEICEFMSIRTAQEICMFLANCECVKLNIMKTEESDLLSDGDAVPELFEFNEYESPEFILAFPLKNALTRYAHVRNVILNNCSVGNI